MYPDKNIQNPEKKDSNKYNLTSALVLQLFLPFLLETTSFYYPPLLWERNLPIVNFPHRFQLTFKTVT
jgi:hypothetical protein